MFAIERDNLAPSSSVLPYGMPSLWRGWRRLGTGAGVCGEGGHLAGQSLCSLTSLQLRKGLQYEHTVEGPINHMCMDPVTCPRSTSRCQQMPQKVV